MPLSLSGLGIHAATIHRNLEPAALYERSIHCEPDSLITSSGALAVSSGKRTGRSPADKRIVDNPASSKDIWWGKINIKMSARVFQINHVRAIDYLNTKQEIFVVDGFAGWDPAYRLKIRVVCSRPYHALFMHNMLIRPSVEELENFGEPDFVILNAGKFPANRFTEEMTSETSVDISFEDKTAVILGTEYAGEMKKGVFTVLNYLMPKRGVLSMHCSANEGSSGDVSLFFGLSGTGKTTLSADPRRKLIGDDEHCWSERGVFNIEGGCYAKCIGLKEENEPEIFKAIRFGAVLENVVIYPDSRDVDYNNASRTENTRACYPIEFIPNAKIPCIGGHPKNIIFLTCDAFGVLPPVSKLSPEQAMYHFISGYTAKVAGTEQGVNEPQATFSACFGAAFMVWHPNTYALLLAAKMREHTAHAWMINTGWSAGPYGVGSRIKLRYTRAMIDAIHDGSLNSVEMTRDPHFGFLVPKHCPNVPDEILDPRKCWKDPAAYDSGAEKLVRLFHENFSKFKDGCAPEIINAGPT